MNVIDLKEKEVFKKEDRGFANLVEEEYLQINQVCLEPGQQVPHHNAIESNTSNATSTHSYRITPPLEKGGEGGFETQENPPQSPFSKGGG